MQAKHILFLTTSNLATNPRLYKESCLAIKNGFIITVVQFKLGNWSDSKSKALRDELLLLGPTDSLSVLELDATRSSFFSWLFLTIHEKTSRLCYRIFSGSVNIAAMGHSKRSLQIIRAFKRVNREIDFICAHNLGALYPANCIADSMKIPFIFDIEDFHPGELIKSDEKWEKRRRELLMKRLLPEAKAITYPSRLIWEETKNLVGIDITNKLILNAFSEKEFISKENSRVRNSDIDFVWFSQNISHGRGLELFLDGAIHWLGINDSAKISITLIGNMYADFNQYLKLKLEASFALNGRLLFNHIPSVSQSFLHNLLNNFDIGLAIEVVNDLNKDICLSNKLFAYMQSGLYILASQTRAQSEFLSTYNKSGLSCELSIEELSASLQEIWMNRESIRNGWLERKISAEKISWERESEKILELWEQADL